VKEKRDPLHNIYFDCRKRNDKMKGFSIALTVN